VARTVTVDLARPDPQALESALAGSDAVLSAVGPRSNADAGIARPGSRAVTAAMKATGAWRIVAISASPVGTVPSPGRPNPPRHDPGDGFLMRHVSVRIAKTLFGKVYPDLARMEDVLRDSGLDWTILRPPQLTDKPLTGTYRTAFGQNVRGGRSIPRADLAHYMLAIVDRPATIGNVIGIATWLHERRATPLQALDEKYLRSWSQIGRQIMRVAASAKAPSRSAWRSMPAPRRSGPSLPALLADPSSISRVISARTAALDRP
jgi:putative NADH-flavin reductase